jgi:hypothetical protein
MDPITATAQRSLERFAKVAGLPPEDKERGAMATKTAADRKTIEGGETPIDTILDRGDYKTQAEAVGDQRREQNSTGAPKTTDLRGAGGPAKEYQLDRGDYTLTARRLMSQLAEASVTSARTIADQTKLVQRFLTKGAADMGMGMGGGSTVGPDSKSPQGPEIGDAPEDEGGPAVDEEPAPPENVEPTPEQGLPSPGNSDATALRLQDKIKEKEQELEREREVLQELKEVMTETTAARVQAKGEQSKSDKAKERREEKEKEQKAKDKKDAADEKKAKDKEKKANLTADQGTNPKVKNPNVAEDEHQAGIDRDDNEYKLEEGDPDQSLATQSKAKSDSTNKRQMQLQYSPTSDIDYTLASRKLAMFTKQAKQMQADLQAKGDDEEAALSKLAATPFGRQLAVLNRTVKKLAAESHEYFTLKKRAEAVFKGLQSQGKSVNEAIDQLSNTKLGSRLAELHYARKSRWEKRAAAEPFNRYVTNLQRRLRERTAAKAPDVQPLTNHLQFAQAVQERVGTLELFKSAIAQLEAKWAETRAALKAKPDQAAAQRLMQLGNRIKRYRALRDAITAGVVDGNTQVGGNTSPSTFDVKIGGPEGTYTGEDAGDKNDDLISDGSDTTKASPATTKVVEQSRGDLDKWHADSMRGSTTTKTSSFTDQEVSGIKRRSEILSKAFKAVQSIAEQTDASVKNPRAREAVGAIITSTLQQLRSTHDELQDCLKMEDRVLARKTAQRLIGSIRSQVAAAKDKTSLISALAEESILHQAKFSRVKPAFVLAMNMVQRGQLDFNGLPMKVAEFIQMKQDAFEVVEATIKQLPAVKTAGRREAERLPVHSVVPETTSVDGVDNIFDEE